MPLTDEQRRTLLASASSLRERMTYGFSAPSTAIEQALVISRLDRWCQATSRGDFAAFEKLLVNRGIDPNKLGQVLGRSPGPDLVVGSDWTESIDAVLDEAARNNAAQVQSDLYSLPYADFYAPFCAVAHQRLLLALPGHAFRLSDDLHRALTDSLAHSLHFVFQSALRVEHGVDHINQEQSGNSVATEKLFSNRLRQPQQLNRFLREYSVAARAASTLMQRWQHNTLEWVQRLSADTVAIANCFLAGLPPGDLTQIECGLSDPHNGGKSVMRLHFASGLRLIYKPRSVALDLVYNNLLDWLEQHGAPYPLRKPVYLDRASYAWIEQVDHTPCNSKESLLQFCSAAGALLCVSYLLDATDLHDSNVIATPTSPVLIDLETLLQPRLASPHFSQKQDALHKAAMLADHTILRSGLLPSLKAGADGTVADVGCLGSLFGAQSAAWYRHESTATPMTEAMQCLMASGDLNPADLVDRIAQAFEQTYGFILSKRDALLDCAGPLQHFKNQEVRFLLRDTTVYIKVLESSFSAQALRSGIDRSITLESLYRIVQNRPYSDALAAAVEAEIAALETLDVPHLRAVTQSAALHSSLGPSEHDLFAQPSYEAMQQRLRNFSEADLARQTEVLRGAFAARMASTPPTTRQQPSPNIAIKIPQSAHNALTTAHAIVDELQSRAIVGYDGSVTWMAPVPIPAAGCFRFDMVPLNRDFGILGIAFFLAAYSHTTGDAAAGALARRATQTVIQRLGIERNSQSSGNVKTSITSMGSTLYSILRLALFLNDPKIEMAAHRLVQRLPDYQGVLSQGLGSVTDRSELCLGLMAMNEHTLALEWGQQLYEHWYRMDHKQQRVAALTSPSLALCWRRLHTMTHAEHFDHVHSETLEVMRKSSEQDATQAVNWHFALLACTRYAGDPVGCSKLQDLFETLHLDGPSVPDNFQYGVCSIAELLITASSKLSHPKLHSTAQRILGDMVQEANSKGGYQTIAGMPRGTFFPAFNQGLSGIGYTLLRSQDASTLPCVQLWD